MINMLLCCSFVLSYFICVKLWGNIYKMSNKSTISIPKKGGKEYSKNWLFSYSAQLKWMYVFKAFNNLVPNMLYIYKMRGYGNVLIPNVQTYHKCFCLTIFWVKQWNAYKHQCQRCIFKWEKIALFMCFFSFFFFFFFLQNW